MKKYWHFKNKKIEINRQNMLNLTVQMWNDMIENSIEEKEDSNCIIEFVRSTKFRDQVRNECFACDFILNFDDNENDACLKCPFARFEDENRDETYLKDYGFCEDKNSPYYKYAFNYEFDDKPITKNIALEICELFIESE